MPQQGGVTRREDPRSRVPHDQADLSDAVQVAFPLLKGRVLAATRSLPGAADLPEPHGFHEEMPTTPQAAVRAIHAGQRALLAAGGHAATPLEIDMAFAAGHAEAVAILQDVGKWGASVAAWFAAIDAVPGLAELDDAVQQPSGEPGSDPVGDRD